MSKRARNKTTLSMRRLIQIIFHDPSVAPFQIALAAVHIAIRKTTLHQDRIERGEIGGIERGLHHAQVIGQMIAASDADNNGCDLWLLKNPAHGNSPEGKRMTLRRSLPPA